MGGTAPGPRTAARPPTAPSAACSSAWNPTPSPTPPAWEASPEAAALPARSERCGLAREVIALLDLHKGLVTAEAPRVVRTH